MVSELNNTGFRKLHNYVFLPESPAESIQNSKHANPKDDIKRQM